MDKKKKEMYDIGYINEDKIASARECTGLVPAMPANEDEAEAYQELYPIPKQGSLQDLNDNIKG